jgi:hypothetical protein
MAATTTTRTNGTHPERTSEPIGEGVVGGAAERTGAGAAALAFSGIRETVHRSRIGQRLGDIGEPPVAEKALRL